jgi:hypothetical protein
MNRVLAALVTPRRKDARRGGGGGPVTTSLRLIERECPGPSPDTATHTHDGMTMEKSLWL